MPKKQLFMVLDTETATLPFTNEIANGSNEAKRKISIARPLIYDFGYVICDRNGEIYDKKQFLIAEIFSVPSIFNTAYYAAKRPIYLEMLKRGKTTIKSWNEVMNYFIDDLRLCRAIGCFNSMFDLKKAIPFTELYISKLYSPDYYEWEETQYHLCETIINNPQKNSKKDFDPEHFTFRGVEYDCFDIWGMACERLLNTNRYKENCLENGLLSASGEYFKSSAESAYQHLQNDFGFKESHTALDDAEIETFLLAKCLRRKGMKYGIDFFPYQQLGHPNEFVEKVRSKEKKKRFAEQVYQVFYDYLGEDWNKACLKGYKKRIKEKAEQMAQYF